MSLGANGSSASFSQSLSHRIRAAKAKAIALRYAAMETQRSTDVSSSQALFDRAVQAMARLDRSSKLAMMSVVVGWFVMNTLDVTLGLLHHGVRFFDIGAVIGDPMRLFFGVDTLLPRIGFGLVCLVCVGAPLASEMVEKKWAWLGYLAPLALILGSGALLYARTSGPLLRPPEDATSLNGSLIHLANDLVQHGSVFVSRRISLGGGVYLALIGSAVLAARGIRRFRRRT